jgi:hypothetical protein
MVKQNKASVNKDILWRQTLSLPHFATAYHESLHVASLWVEHTGMNLRCRIFSFLVGIDSTFLHNSSLEEVEALFNHIEFH